jgi:hypothetical protein
MSCSFTNQVLAQIMLYKNNDEAFAKKYVEFAKSGKLEKKVYVLPKILDEEVARLHLAHVNAELTTLTSAQAEYLGLDVEGPFKSDQYVPTATSWFPFETVANDTQLPLLIHCCTLSSLQHGRFRCEEAYLYRSSTRGILEGSRGMFSKIIPLLFFSGIVFQQA